MFKQKDNKMIKYLNDVKIFGFVYPAQYISLTRQAYFSVN